MGSALSTNCRTNVLQSHIDQCNGQQSCSSIPACQSAHGGDPCPLSTKYLEISYQCKPTTPSASWAGSTGEDVRSTGSTAGQTGASGAVAVGVIVALLALTVLGAIAMRRSRSRVAAVLPQGGDPMEMHHSNDAFAFQDHGVGEARWSQEPAFGDELAEAEE